MNGIFAEEDENTHYFSRSDEEEVLGTHYPEPFFLDDYEWPTIEHYYQAMKFNKGAHQDKIRTSKTPQKARKLGRSRFNKRRADWADIKTTVMTRAIYIRCKTHDSTRATLEETADLRLIENSNYDYFWGCGRDRRGENHYGKAMMNVREKLRTEEQ